MTILPRPSVSPLHSFASLPTHRAPSLSDALRSIIGWLTNRQPTPPKSEEQLEARLVDLLAEELAENGETSLDETKQDGDHRGMPPLAPKRPSRLTGREDR